MDLAALSVMMGQPLDGSGSPGPGTPTPSPAPQPSAPTGAGDGGSPMDAAFPTSGYEGILDPQAIKAARAAALFRAGLALMAAGGPRPKGTRNVGMDLMNAFNPDYFNSELDRQVQAKQLGMQLGGTRAIQQITSQDPGDPNESPVGRANRTAGMASRLLSVCATPMCLQAAGQLSSIAKNLHDSIPKTEMVEGSDDTGRRGHWLVSSEDGSRLQFFPLGANLTPSEQAAHAQEVLSGFQKERTPLYIAKQSLDAFHTIYDQVKSRSAIDPQQGATLVSLANDVLHPGTHIPEEQLMAGQTAELPGELGHIINAILDAKHMTPEQAKSLKDMVDSVAEQRATASAYVQNYWRGVWQTQVGNYPGVENIDDPWAGFRPGVVNPAPRTGTAGTGAGGTTDWSPVFPWLKH